MDEATRNTLEKQTSKIGKMLFVYQICMVIAAILYSLAILVERARTAKMTSFMFEELLSSLTVSGWPSIWGITAGMCIIFFFSDQNFSDGTFTRKSKKMKLSDFIQIFFCFMSVQSIINLIATVAEYLFNVFGFSILNAMQTASSVSTTFSMFLYAAILGPIAEEIVFRGIVLRNLEKYGKVFAIIVSSALFGFLHSNLIQGVFAAVIGLILGYVTVEYSFKWAVILHIINNFIFAELLGYLKIQYFPNFHEFNLIMLSIFFIIGAIVLIKNRQYLRQYIATHRSERNVYQYTFSSLWIVLFIALNIVLAFTGIQPLT